MRRAGQGRILVVEADGGSRGNPGPAGYGALVRDGAQVLAERAAAIGVATNNVAEYRGLIAGLQAVAEIDPHAEVEVRMDSKLVVEQMSGRWKVKHDKLQPLARQAASLVRGLGRVSFRWVPREQNTGADRLANEAMDAAAEGREWQPSTPAVPDPPVVVDAGADAGAGRGPGASSPGPAAPRPGWRMPASPPLTTLLIRHGQTVHSVERRFSGASDPPLTDLGEAQARATARRLAAFASAEPAVVSSPLRRASRTAELIAKVLGTRPQVDERLRETDFGAWEGLGFPEVMSGWSDLVAQWLTDETVAPPGGESFLATYQRVRAARDDLVRRFSGGTVVVVSHVTPIKLLARIALDAPPAVLHRLHIDLAAVSVVDWYKDGPAVLRGFNDVSHLAGVVG